MNTGEVRSTDGKHVWGYLGKGDTLKTWDGRVILACRSARHGEYRDHDGETTFGVVWYLTGGRAIVGYCLGEGMLFRGTLVYANQDTDRECRAECEHWREVDADEAARGDQADEVPAGWDHV